MKLYYSAGTCSLASHIMLIEAKLNFEAVRVDIETRRTQNNENFNAINPKGYVPTLALEAGVTLTECVAILDWISQQGEDLLPSGTLGRTRLIEALAFISTEMQKPFVRWFFAESEQEKTVVGVGLEARFTFIAERLDGMWLLDHRFTAADALLYVMLRWANMAEIATPARLVPYFQRIDERPAVQAALAAEGLL